MSELSLFSQVSLYMLLGLMGLFSLLLWVWQFMILRGKSFNNPDGSTDDWHEQKTHYGIAFADVFPLVFHGRAVYLKVSRGLQKLFAHVRLRSWEFAHT